MVGTRAANQLAQGASTVMFTPDLVNVSGLMDDAKCFALVRQHRWPEGGVLPRVRQWRGDQGRARRHAVPPAAVSLQGVRVPLR